MTREQTEYRHAIIAAYSRNRTQAILMAHITWRFSYRRKRGFGVQMVRVGEAGLIKNDTPLGEPEYYRPDDPDGVPIERIKAHLDLAYKLSQLL
jgi:hypothetical protein